MSQSSTGQAEELMIEADPGARERLIEFSNAYGDDVDLTEERGLGGVEILVLYIGIELIRRSPEIISATAELVTALKSDGKNPKAVLPDGRQRKNPSADELKELLGELLSESKDENGGR